MSEKYQAPCEECGGKCCDYVAIEIDKPKNKTDYDNIRWYLVHKNINIFIDHDKKWHVEFRTPCEEQMKNKKCGIYLERPKICREHGESDGECEFYDSPYSKYFSKVKEFEKYLTKQGKNWRFKRK